MTSIEYAVEAHLQAVEFVDVLRRSTLAVRRPVDQISTIAGMSGDSVANWPPATVDRTTTGRDREWCLARES